jgi:hypothetical protein
MFPGIKTAICLLYLFFMVKTCFCSSQSRIEDAKRLYFSGYYGEAIDSLSNIISGDTALSRTDSMNNFEYQAFCFAMLNKNESCKRAFRDLLSIDSLYMPDSLVVHPRIQTLFRKARQEFRKQGLTAKNISRFWYAAPFGVGHVRNKRYYRATALMLIQAGAVVSFSLAYNNFLDARDPDLGWHPENIKKGERYQLYMRLSLSGFFIGYLLGLADGIFLD